MTVSEISELFLKKEYMLNMGAGKLSKWLNCTKEDIYTAKELARKGSNKSRFPKILVFDIETSPLEAYVFQKEVWRASIGADKVISEWFMLTWSAKWLFSPEVMSDKLTGKEALEENDKRIVKSLWNLLDEADIVIAHNGDKFDVPNINTRFIIHNLPPTTPYQQIDTKKVAYKQFGFTHNSLNGLADFFGFARKKDTDFALWKACKDGKDDALAYMEEYNQHDVVLLEEVYLKLRPWIKSHPNIGLYLDLDIPVCSNCGKDKLKEIPNQFYYTQTSKFPLYRCSCGTITRGRKSVQDKEVRSALVVGLAR